MNFADKLKSILQAHKVSQIELSRRTKISKSIISEYIHGKYEPKTDNLKKIAAALNITLAELSDDYISTPPTQTAPQPTPADTFTEAERNHIDMLRALSPEARRRVERNLKNEYEDTIDSKIEDAGSC